jgi:hypothetical protein
MTFHKNEGCELIGCPQCNAKVDNLLIDGYTHCCACSGTCGHTTPPSYCAKHSQSNIFKTTGLTGWICPVCNAGVSPFAQQCPNNHSNMGFIPYSPNLVISNN